MEATTNWINWMDRTIGEVADRGLIQHQAEAIGSEGPTVRIHGRTMVNFALCSYLALEADPRLKRGVVDAVMRYGTQFASSRAYVSAPPYAELEALLEAIFGGYVLATPTTTLGHIAAVPLLIEDGDAVIMDQQVHNSVQTAVGLLHGRPITVETLPHSDLAMLEDRLSALRRRHRRIWYLADGVYSMAGDLAPVAALEDLLDHYEQFHIYYDDAHGMSWAGEHGRGCVLRHAAIRPRTVVATSLCKAFSAAGGALVFSDRETCRKVKTCGSSMIFSGPIQPPMLGAAIASAHLHLSDEIVSLQDELMGRILYCNEILLALGLPLASLDATPIRFVRVGPRQRTCEFMAGLMEDGYYTNLSMFPIVPRGHAGIRFTLTRHHSYADIERFIETLARHYREADKTGPDPYRSDAHRTVALVG